ncbi:MAG: carbohydrate kinase [Chloroflexota bacterium]
MIVVCGEALIDLVPRTCGDEPGFVPRTGGSPYNVAIGLGRLGVPTAFLGRVSRDRFGRVLREALVRDGVDVRWLGEGTELSTLAVVHLTEDAEPEFAFYGEGAADVMLHVDDLPAAFPDEVTALDFGSISLLREPGASTFEALMRREHGRRFLCLDPNVRPGLIPDRAAYVRRLEGWVALMDLVKVSRVDLGWLYPDRSIAEVATAWRALGPELVVVTRGGEGGVAFGAGQPVAVPAPAVTVSDTVGAGDAFTSGLLAWLHDHDALSRTALRALTPDRLAAAVEQGNRVAGITCERAGAQPPTRAELTGAAGS